CERQKPDHRERSSFPVRLELLERLPIVVESADDERMPCHGLLHLECVLLELGSDRGPDEIGSIRIETLVHEKIDLSEVDSAYVDGELFRVRHGKFPSCIRVRATGQDSACHPYGWYLDGMWNLNALGGIPSSASWRGSRTPILGSKP